MKLQIEGQHWRIRLDEDELAQLLAGQTVQTASNAAQQFTWRYGVALSAQPDARLEGDAAQWSLSLPEADVRVLAARLPTRDGLEFRLAGERTENDLMILLDVDVRDSARRRRNTHRDS